MLLGLMQTDSTEAGVKPYTCDSEFTHAWDTVGAGVNPKPASRELNQDERKKGSDNEVKC